MKKKPVVRRVRKVEASIKDNARVVVRHVPRRKLDKSLPAVEKVQPRVVVRHVPRSRPHPEVPEKSKHVDGQGASAPSHTHNTHKEHQPASAELPAPRNASALAAEAAHQYPAQAVPQYPAQWVPQYQYPAQGVPQYPAQGVPQYPAQEVPQYPVGNQYPVQEAPQYPVAAGWTTTAMFQTTPSAVALTTAAASAVSNTSRTSEDTDDDAFVLSCILIVLVLIALYWLFAPSFRLMARTDAASTDSPVARRRTIQSNSADPAFSSTPSMMIRSKNQQEALRNTLRSKIQEDAHIKGPQSSSSSSDESVSPRTVSKVVAESEPVSSALYRPKFNRQTLQKFHGKLGIHAEDQSEEAASDPIRGRARGSTSATSATATPPGMMSPGKPDDERDFSPTGLRSNRNVRRLRSTHRMDSKSALAPAG